MDMPQWDEDLQTGILWQDVQHQRFFEVRDRLAAAVHQGETGMEEFQRTIRFLDQYVEDHFGVEERYMAEYDFPQRKEHLKAHQNFRSQIQAMKDRYRTETEGLPEEIELGDLPVLDMSALDLSLDLTVWFCEHIRGLDRNLGQFLLSKGVR